MSEDSPKPFTNEELNYWSKTGGPIQSQVAKRLASRVLELEAENERQRELLKGIVHFADGFLVYRTDSPAGFALAQWLEAAEHELSKGESDEQGS